MTIESVAAKSLASASVQQAVAHARISQATEDVEKLGDEKIHEKSLDTLNEIAYVCDLSPQDSLNMPTYFSTGGLRRRRPTGPRELHVWTKMGHHSHCFLLLAHYRCDCSQFTPRSHYSC